MRVGNELLQSVHIVDDPLLTPYFIIGYPYFKQL